MYRQATQAMGLLEETIGPSFFLPPSVGLRWISSNFDRQVRQLCERSPYRVPIVVRPSQLWLHVSWQ
jgi:hypothetical protein